MKRQIHCIVDEVKRLAHVRGLPALFSIANTKKATEKTWFPPVRETSVAIVGNAIVNTVEDASLVATHIDGLIDYVLVDTEEKSITGNMVDAVKRSLKKTTVLTFKPNDLTVASIDSFIASNYIDLSKKTIGIVGVGNIGSKLALMLVERGATIKIYRRNKEKAIIIAAALNEIKASSAPILVVNSEEEACAADVVVGCTSGTEGISEAGVHAMKNGSLLIDAGKGTISPAAISLASKKGIEVVRTDMRAGFEGAISTIFATKRLLSTTMGRRTIAGASVVAGGLMGEEGEIIVDSITDPKRVVGIADGKGDVIRSPNENQKNIYAQVAREIQKTNG